jgi:DNA-binding NtrC family response regulator
MRLNPAACLRVPPLRERREDLPELLRFALIEAMRGEALRPLVRAFLARFPTPADFREEESQVIFGKPEARRARRDAFTLFLSRTALSWLRAHDWPGNHRELKMLAINALSFVLAEHLDSAQPSDEEPAPRAPAILALPDALIARLLGQLPAEPEPGPRLDETAEPPPLRAARGASTSSARIVVEVGPGPSFVKIAADVERQYLRALFEASGGDLDVMARRLFGPGASGRRVHMRLNQLGLKLRELRGART